MPQYRIHSSAASSSQASSFEKAVKGGTKVKLAAPKTKYVEHILLATQSGEAGVAEVFRALTPRLRDSTWTIAFKALILVHLMINEGAPDVTLRWLAQAPTQRLAINQFTDVQTQGYNLRCYSEYLLARAQAYGVAKSDLVRSGAGRMKRLSVDKGLLRETEVVQDVVGALLLCDLLTHDADNDISLTAFRLLTRDLLDVYNVENEAVMGVLAHYFEMSRPDAERAIRIYKAFCKQTEQVVQYLSVARQYEHATRLEIPKIKHAPTSLATSLQEYLDDVDFDVNRRQYLAEQEAKRTGKPVQRFKQETKTTSKSASSTVTAAAASSQTTAAAASSAPVQPKGPAPDLIDFFESIEQNQEPMAQGIPQPQVQSPYQQQQLAGYPMQTQQTGYPMQQQQTGYAAQQPFNGLPQIPEQTGANGFVSNVASTNPFGQQPQPLQTQFTGAGFGGYGPQPPQQQQQHIFGSPAGNGLAQQQDPNIMYASPVQQGQTLQAQIQQQPMPMQAQPTGTNPFRQSTMPTGAVGNAFLQQSQQQQQQPPAALQRQSTNPFARVGQQTQQQPPLPFPSQPQQPAFSPLQSQPTGTNPFARAPSSTSSQPQAPASSAFALQPQQTGTNPFRQSTAWQGVPGIEGNSVGALQMLPQYPHPVGQVAPQQSSGQGLFGPMA